jgi:hypothetical protein
MRDRELYSGGAMTVAKAHVAMLLGRSGEHDRRGRRDPATYNANVSTSQRKSPLARHGDARPNSEMRPSGVGVHSSFHDATPADRGAAIWSRRYADAPRSWS